MSENESDLDAIFDRDKARKQQAREAEELAEQGAAEIRHEASAIIDTVIRPALETLRDQLMKRGHQAAVEMSGAGIPQVRLTFSVSEPYGLPSSLTFSSYSGAPKPSRSIRASWDLRVPNSSGVSSGDDQDREFKGVDAAWVRGVAVRFIDAVVSGS